MKIPQISGFAAVAIALAACSSIGGFVYLSAIGGDVAGYVKWLSGPFVTIVLGWVIAGKIDTSASSSSSDAGKKQDELVDRLQGVESQLDAAEQQRTDIAAGAGPTGPGGPVGPAQAI